MFEDLTKAIDEFKKAKSIAIFTPEINTVDKAASVIALAKICSKKQKSFQILSPKTLKTPIRNMFKNEDLDVVSSPVSKDFVVSVDYSVGNIDKVICKRDEDSKKLNFVITPKDELFNFDNVELISGGTSFDLVFSLDLESLDVLEDSFKNIFENTNVISVTKKEGVIGKYKILINGQKSYSEVVYEFAKAFSDTLSEDMLNVLLQGVISKYKLMENGEDDGWLIINKFVKYGADFNKAVRDLYYSKDYENFQLQRKVLENLRIDRENRVLWSKVSVMMDVDSTNLDIRGKILFNICKDFDIAFVIYHLDKDNVRVVFESNDPEKYSAIELAKVFSGTGTKSRAVFNSGDILAEDFESKVFDAIYSIFGIRVS